MINLSHAKERRYSASGRSAAIGAALIALIAIGALTPAARSADTQGTQRPAVVLGARTLNATDTAHLHYISSSGSLLFEEGSAAGTIPGRMQTHCDVGPTVSANFTIFVRGGGAIDGHGTAIAHGSGVYESFAGTLTVTGGSGRYTHARGRAGLYGVFDRRTYTLTVQTTGRLLY